MEEKERKPKKKLWIALASLALVVIIGLGITVGVLAASSVSVSNSVTVSYTSVQVAAEVSGTYQVHGAESATSFQKTGGGTTITFDGSETGAAATGTFVAVNDIELTSEHASVVFVYTFHNTSGYAITATCTLPATQTNVTITETDGELNTAVSNHQITIAAGATKTYKITVAVTSLAHDASFTGSFGWVLAKASA